MLSELEHDFNRLLKNKACLRTLAQAKVKVEKKRGNKLPDLHLMGYK